MVERGFRRRKMIDDEYGSSAGSRFSDQFRAMARQVAIHPCKGFIQKTKITGHQSNQQFHRPALTETAFAQTLIRLYPRMLGQFGGRRLPIPIDGFPARRTAFNEMLKDRAYREFRWQHRRLEHSSNARVPTLPDTHATKATAIDPYANSMRVAQPCYRVQ